MIFSDQLAIYLNNNKIIVKQQCGFRKCHSLNGVLLIHLKKGFDMVDQQI